jgi:hypothetical protein
VKTILSGDRSLGKKDPGPLTREETTGEALEASPWKNRASKLDKQPQRAPERSGEQFGRHFYINDPDAVAKSADSIFGCGQGLRGRCTRPAEEGRHPNSALSVRPAVRRNYRTIAVMRNTHTA